MEAETDVRLDERFRFVIPEEIRKSAGLSPGSRLIIRYEVRGRKIQMTIIPARLVPEG